MDTIARQPPPVKGGDLHSGKDQMMQAAATATGGKRKLELKPLLRRQPLFLRQKAQPWMRVCDTAWSFCAPSMTYVTNKSAVSKWVLKQLQWPGVDHLVGKIVPLEIKLERLGDEHFVCKAVVVEEASPSLTIGQDLLKQFEGAG